MHPARTRWTARILLLASFLMVIDTACSHAPAPDRRMNPRDYQGNGVVVRFHTDRVTYVTSSYAVTDSSVVIRNILRDPKYYNPMEAELHERVPAPPPEDTALPVEVLMRDVRYMDRWQPVEISDNSTKGTLLVIGIVAGFVAAMVIAIVNAND